MNSDKSSKPPGKSSSIPYKKLEKKKNPLADAAKKYFAKKSPVLKKRKPKSDEASDGGNSGKEFPRKKFFSPKIAKDEAPDGYVEIPKLSEDIRLNKYLSHAGVASRRKADELIREGKVKVNGTVVVEMGYKVKAKD